MTPQRERPPQKDDPTSNSLAAVDNPDSNHAITCGNHSYNVTKNGIRIASFLTQAQAIQFAVKL